MVGEKGTKRKSPGCRWKVSFYLSIRQNLQTNQTSPIDPEICSQSGKIGETKVPEPVTILTQVLSVDKRDKILHMTLN